MNFCSGGVVEGTISQSSGPKRPEGIPCAAPQMSPPPKLFVRRRMDELFKKMCARFACVHGREHYVFDTEVELWMPPSAVSKEAEAATKPREYEIITPATQA